MLILYTREGCGYSGMVKAKLKELGLACTEKNTLEEDVAKELLARGGEVKTPYFVDEETGVEMYESDLITTYLDEHYGK